jgi:hypothetical protein
MEDPNKKSLCDIVRAPESGSCRLCLECHTTWLVSNLEDGLCPNCHSSTSHDSPKVEVVSDSYNPAPGKKAKAIKGQLNLFDGRL